MDGGKHQVGSSIHFIMEKMIEQYNHDSTQRKKEDEPWISSSCIGDPCHAKVKGNSHHTDEKTGQNRKNNPFYGGTQTAQIVFDFMYHKFFGNWFIHDVVTPFLYKVNIISRNCLYFLKNIYSIRNSSILEINLQDE